MKKIFAIIVVVLVIAGVVIWNRQPKEVAGAPIKIGAVIPLSGPVASAGEFVKHGIELAVADALAEGNPIEVVYEDSQYDAKLGLSAYNKLKLTSNVKAIFSFGTPPTMALAPVVNADKIPMLAIVATQSYSTPNDFTYRVSGSADMDAKSAVDVLVTELGKKKIAVLYVNNDYGKGSLDALKKFMGSKAAVVAEESSLLGAVDYRSQLTKIKSANPDAIFLGTGYKEAGLILKQAKEMGINTVFMCGQPCEHPEVITVAGQAAEGLIVAAPTSAETSGFAERYEKAYGVKPSYLSLRSYDSTKILAAVAKECQVENYDGDCLRQELDKVKNFPGLSYSITFDENGDIKDQFVIKVVKGGQLVDYK